MEWTKTHYTVVMMNIRLQISKLKLTKHAAVILHPYHVTSFQRLVLIRKTKLLTFSFITATLLDVLDKNRYQHNIS